MQAHTLGEVDTLSRVLLRVSSGTILTVFNEIGSYLTDREQKNKLAQLFLRHGVFCIFSTGISEQHECKTVNTVHWFDASCSDTPLNNSITLISPVQSLAWLHILPLTVYA